MDGVATLHSCSLGEATRCSGDVDSGVLPANEAAARLPEACGWAALASSTVVAGMAAAVASAELNLALQLPCMLAFWLTISVTDRSRRMQGLGSQSPATVTATIAADLVAWFTALTAVSPLLVIIGLVATAKIVLLRAAWQTAGWRNPSAGAAEPLRRRLAAACAAEAAVAVALLLGTGGLHGCDGPDARCCAASAVGAIALQAAVAIGVVRSVALPVALLNRQVCAVACGATESTVDAAGPVWTWVAARPFVARTGVLVTAGTAAGTATAAVAVAGAAAATRRLPPDAPSAIVAVAAAAPVLVVAAAAVGAWRRWVARRDWATWCKGGGCGSCASEATPLMGAA